jgi:hypothetical protein
MTPIKQYDLANFLNWWFRLARGASKGKPIIYIDTNAGSGYNPMSGCDGSPVVFCKKAMDWQVDYRLFAIEKDKSLYSQLVYNLSGFENCNIFNSDNQVTTLEILQSLKSGLVGLIYVDYNGIPDWGMIEAVSRHQNSSRLDILIRYNSNALWRNRHNGYLELPEYLSNINKKCWWGKLPEKGDLWYWSFLLGMNYPYGGWEKEGWLSFATQAGKQLKERLTYSPGQLKKKRQAKQLTLTGLMENIYSIPILELSEREPSRGLMGYVRDAIAGQLRKFIM